MWISSFYLDGYRHFEAQTIDLENQSTVIAGANNSGKTSLIDLLRVVLRPEGNVRADDFSATQRLLWSKRLIEAALGGEDSYRGLLDQEDVTDHSPSIDVKIVVKYDPVNDDIREFADFLMDLDSAKSSFYFQYLFKPRADKLVLALSGLYLEIQERLQKANWVAASDVDFSSSTFLSLQSAFDKALMDSCRPDTFFADESFTNLVPMERSRFLKLFNFKPIKASRTLDDISEDKTGALNKRLVDVAKESKEWAEVLATLPALVLGAIDSTGIRSVTSEETLKSLNAVIESISKTNGSSQSDLFLDFQVTENDAIQLITRAMQTRYSGGGVPLGEASQGLGYSNLILLHLETESFIRAAAAAENAFRVNLLVIEEPESHMHPQMQNAFIRHLFERVSEAAQFQALVTTHSNEIVRSSSIEQLRVLKISDAVCRIIDLRKFHETKVAGRSPEEQRLFSFMYSINFSDVLFADKVVMYEGDTERMYIQALIETREDLAGLRTQYISYVQVGGAHAHIYKPLIVDTLGIKTIIITDLDYEKSSTTSTPEALQPLKTTNATLNALFGIEKEGKQVAPTLEHLFKMKSPETGVAGLEGQPLVAVAFQSSNEGYARTLEEAILASLLEAMVWDSKPRAEWSEYRDTSKLKFSISTEPSSPTIRQIVSSTSNIKTDFMYSLLLKKDFQTGVPPYILSALKWLDA
jgi:predicted ATP-dependent endonuclease of OLD family